MAKKIMAEVDKETEKTLTDADKIWEEISKLPVDMYSLPRQTIGQHVIRLKGIDDGVCLKFKSSAALPAVEASLAARRVVVPRKKNNFGDPINMEFPKWQIEEHEGYVIVRRASLPPEQEELTVGEFVIVKSDQK